METECPGCDDLLRERDDLAARLAAVEAERDELDGRFENLADRAEGYLSRAEAAEAEIEFMRAWCDGGVLLTRRSVRLRARLAEVEAERDTWSARAFESAGLYLDERAEHTQTWKRVDAADARLAAVRALCDVDDGDVVTRAEIRAVLAAVDGPAEGWPDEDAARFLDHERQQRAAVDPPADHIALFDGPTP